MISHSARGFIEKSALAKLVNPAKPSQQKAPVAAPYAADGLAKWEMTTANPQATSRPQTSAIKYLSPRRWPAQRKGTGGIAPLRP